MTLPISIPDYWEHLLKAYVKRIFYEGTRKSGFSNRPDFTEGDYRFFAKGVGLLNEAFTLERGSLPQNYFNRKELRSGYLLYFLPVNALKVAALMPDLPPSPSLAKEGEKGGGLKLTILDLGSGPGTGMFGMFAHLERLAREGKCGPISLEWILIDQNREVLNDALSLHAALIDHWSRAHPGRPLRSRLQTLRADLSSTPLHKILPPQKADLVFGLNFLSEQPHSRRLPIIESCFKNYLLPSGRLLLMEPALRSTTRDLMHLRDQILSEGIAHVYSPCLHQAACPMLKASDRDWCHTYIPWDRPPWIDKIDRLVGIRKNYLKCSYMILGALSQTSPAAFGGLPLLTKERDGERSLWRVVSGTLNSKGKSERLLCGPGGLPNLLRVMRLDRDQGPSNRDFDRLGRGDLVILPKTERIRRDTIVEKQP